MKKKNTRKKNLHLATWTGWQNNSQCVMAPHCGTKQPKTNKPTKKTLSSMQMQNKDSVGCSQQCGTKVSQWLSPCHQSNWTLSAALYSRNKHLSISERTKSPAAGRRLQMMGSVSQATLNKRAGLQPTLGLKVHRIYVEKRKWVSSRERRQPLLLFTASGHRRETLAAQ